VVNLIITCQDGVGPAVAMLVLPLKAAQELQQLHLATLEQLLLDVGSQPSTSFEQHSRRRSSSAQPADTSAAAAAAAAAAQHEHAQLRQQGAASPDVSFTQWVQQQQERDTSELYQHLLTAYPTSAVTAAEALVWHHHVSSLHRDLQYLLTSTPTMFPDEERQHWDSDTYLGSLTDTMHYLQENSCWQLLAALLQHCDSHGLKVVQQSRRVPRSSISADFVRNLFGSRTSTSLDGSMPLAASTCRNTMRRCTGSVPDLTSLSHQAQTRRQSLEGHGRASLDSSTLPDVSYLYNHSPDAHTLAFRPELALPLNSNSSSTAAAAASTSAPSAPSAATAATGADAEQCYSSLYHDPSQRYKFIVKCWARDRRDSTSLDLTGAAAAAAAAAAGSSTQRAAGDALQQAGAQAQGADTSGMVRRSVDPLGRWLAELPAAQAAAAAGPGSGRASRSSMAAGRRNSQLMLHSIMEHHSSSGSNRSSIGSGAAGAPGRSRSAPRASAPAAEDPGINTEVWEGGRAALQQQLSSLQHSSNNSSRSGSRGSRGSSGDSTAALPFLPECLATPAVLASKLFHSTSNSGNNSNSSTPPAGGLYTPPQALQQQEQPAAAGRSSISYTDWARHTQGQASLDPPTFMPTNSRPSAQLPNPRLSSSAAVPDRTSIGSMLGYDQRLSWAPSDMGSRPSYTYSEAGSDAIRGSGLMARAYLHPDSADQKEVRWAALPAGRLPPYCWCV
jgi:hypothetical protein